MGAIAGDLMPQEPPGRRVSLLPSAGSSRVIGPQVRAVLRDVHAGVITWVQ